MFKRFLCTAAASAALPAAMAFPPPCGNVNCQPGASTARQVNLSGATLLRGFFFDLAHTNDYVDVDGDGDFKFNCNGGGIVDSLGPRGGTFGVYNDWWVVQNRAVGSVNGFNEFVSYEICCDLPELFCTDESSINSEVYATAGPPAGPNLFFAGPCTQDNDGDGIPNGINRATLLPDPRGTGTPLCPCSLDIAILDVPSRWAVQVIGGTPAWFRKPAQGGYGVNPNPSVGISGSCAAPGPFLSQLGTLTRPCNPRTLNLDVDNPDQDTLFDTPLAHAPVVPIANRGTGLRNVTFTQLRYMMLSGRNQNGENLAVGCRDVGSGTNNAWLNSLGIDPAWGRGDNRGGEAPSTNESDLGPCHRMSNCGSSSIVENGVQQRRLGVGYSGISGSSAAANDMNRGFYEILNVGKDIDPAWNGTSYVRPTVPAIVCNADVNTGWQIAGPGTLVTRGNPRVSAPSSEDNPAIPNSVIPTDCGEPINPTYNYDPTDPAAMNNENAADYIYNIETSVREFSGCPGCPTSQLMPGQFLARTFYLVAGLDAAQSLSDPTVFTPQAANADLKAFMLANNNYDVAALAPQGPPGLCNGAPVLPDFGTKSEAGFVPRYRTGGTINDYRYRDQVGTVFTLAYGTGVTRVSIRNRVAGDFLYDEQRNCADIPNMMTAFAAGRDGAGVSQYFENPLPPFPGGAMDDPALPNTDANGQNIIVVDIMGDLDGSGQFDDKDIRYFADGCSLVSGTLNRQCGFTAVDTNWTVSTSGHPAGNFFNTTVVDACGNSRPYTAGASRFDVAGSASGPAKGDNPIGADGVVDEDDFCYIWQNQGSWASLNDAVKIDLSCDMNGDLIVNLADVKLFCSQGWGRCFGDIDCNGQVDINDLSRLLANFGQVGGVTYTDGDMNCDGQIDIDDLSLLLGSFGGSHPGCF